MTKVGKVFQVFFFISVFIFFIELTMLFSQIDIVPFIAIGVLGGLTIFLRNSSVLGSLDTNNKFGVFGTISEKHIDKFSNNLIEVANQDEVKSGKADIGVAGISFSEESDAAAKKLEGFEEVSDENIMLANFLGIDPTKYQKPLPEDPNIKYILVDHHERITPGEIVAIIDHHPTDKDITCKYYQNERGNNHE